MAGRFKRFSRRIAQWPSFASGVAAAALVMLLGAGDAAWGWHLVIALVLLASMGIAAPERKRYRAMGPLVALAAVAFLPAVREAGPLAVLFWGAAAGSAVGAVAGLTRVRMVHERETAEAMTTALTLAVAVGAGMLLGAGRSVLPPLAAFATLLGSASAITVLCYEEFARNHSIRPSGARAAAWVGGLLSLQALFAYRILPFSPIEGGIFIGLLLVLYREAVALAAEGLLSRRRLFMGALVGTAGFLLIAALVVWSV